MHSSRKLQLEQATLMADGFMGTTSLDEQQTLIQRKVKNEPLEHIIFLREDC
jgi:hypothetical protein